MHYVCVRFATEKQSSNGRAGRRRDRVPLAGVFLLQGSGERPPCVGWDAERRTVAVGSVAHHHAFGRRDFDALPAVAAAVAALTPVVHIPVILSIRASDSLAL
jgi:hypothetical protein